MIEKIPGLWWLIQLPAPLPSPEMGEWNSKSLSPGQPALKCSPKYSLTWQKKPLLLSSLGKKGGQDQISIFLIVSHNITVGVGGLVCWSWGSARMLVLSTGPTGLAMKPCRRSGLQEASFFLFGSRAWGDQFWSSLLRLTKLVDDLWNCFIPRLELLIFEDFSRHVIECDNPGNLPPTFVLVSFHCEDLYWCYISCGSPNPSRQFHLPMVNHPLGADDLLMIHHQKVNSSLTLPMPCCLHYPLHFISSQRHLMVPRHHHHRKKGEHSTIRHFQRQRPHSDNFYYSILL